MAKERGLAGRVASMKEFARGLWSYRRSLAALDARTRAFAHEHGLAVNPHRLAYRQRMVWLAENEHLYGHGYCPSFEPTADPMVDESIVCPCAYLGVETDGRRVCHCALFGVRDATAAEFSAAEQRHARAYELDSLRWVGEALDTRGRHLDEQRGLPVPDAIHQVKQALARRGLPLTAIVATQVEANHLRRLGAIRGFSCVYDARVEGGLLVRMGEA